MKAGIVCCSNGLSTDWSKKQDTYTQILSDLGITPVYSPYLIGASSVFSGTAKQRTDVLLSFYSDPEIRMIFDISGGDIANQILSELDFKTIAASDAVFFGYSDLTTILNAIYTKTGKPSVLYQTRNFLKDHAAQQIRAFREFLSHPDALSLPDSVSDIASCSAPEATAAVSAETAPAASVETDSSQHCPELFDVPWTMLRGESCSGIVVGGNIRCFLKLAGTPFWPDLKGKLLFLEAWSGLVPQLTTYLNQLKQIGAFEQVSGILLGTFTQMEEEHGTPSAEELVLDLVPDSVPVAKTGLVGHGSDSKALWIGKFLNIRSSSILQS